MRIRKIIAEDKVLSSDTQWRTDDLQPRHSYIFEKTKPTRAGWQWRSTTATGTAGEYVLLTQCNPRKEEWKAWLILKTPSGAASLVSRLEYHGSHPGLHVHADCNRGGIEEGASSIETRVRIPPADKPHRRINAWRENTFWELARQHYRIQFPTGSLL
jgi:hypothetical protein